MSNVENSNQTISFFVCVSVVVAVLKFFFRCCYADTDTVDSLFFRQFSSRIVSLVVQYTFIIINNDLFYVPFMWLLCFLFRYSCNSILKLAKKSVLTTIECI